MLDLNVVANPPGFSPVKKWDGSGLKKWRLPSLKKELKALIRDEEMGWGNRDALEEVKREITRRES